MNFKEGMIKFGKGAWHYIKLAKIELIVIAAAIAFDLITKSIIESTMTENQSITLIPKFLHFTYVINTKAAFGSAFGLENFMSDEAIRIVFLVVTGIAMAVFAYFMFRFRGKNLILRLAFAFIIGGGLGNYYDRLVLKGVRDFVEIEYFGCNLPLLGSSFAIFNMADAILTAGVVMFLVYYIFLYKDPKKVAEKAAAESVKAESENVLDDGKNLQAQAINADIEPNSNTNQDKKEKSGFIEDTFDDEQDNNE